MPDKAAVRLAFSLLPQVFSGAFPEAGVGGSTEEGGDDASLSKKNSSFFERL